MSSSVLSVFNSPWETAEDSHGEPLDVTDLRPVIDSINAQEGRIALTLNERSIEQGGELITAFTVDYTPQVETDFGSGEMEPTNLDSVLFGSLTNEGVTFESVPPSLGDLLDQE